ncbi:MAG TPA: thioredoxin-disulfide reductase [Dehalococcoidia bacterium]|jgi:thioredoxin reductase (NADPH)|nr:thioredoxin-disulfide reductase [Dehalococcoidia bacterium]
MAETREYDVVIIGGGPAGLAAGLYAARGRHKTVLIEKGVIGGQIALTELVENYPGIPQVNGFDLAQTMLQQAESYGLETEYTSVTGITQEPADQRGKRRWTVQTEAGDFRAKALIVTAGAEYNRLGIPGEERLTGKGVSYCATCDAAFFKDQPVAIVGGGDAALDEGIFTTRYVSKATVVHRRDELRASMILQERALANPKMEIAWNTVVDEVVGDNQVRSIKLRNVVTGETSEMPVSAVFIFIGNHPNSDFIGDLVPKDAAGHIIVDDWMATPLPGLFAAGDVRQNSARQVASSVGDGVTAAIAADHYISSEFHEESPAPKAETAQAS